MYLSKLMLNSRNTQVYRDIGNAHALHQRIMQGFPDEQRNQPRADWNILYRQEPDSQIVLVQSDITPDWHRLPQDYLEHHETKSLALMLTHIKAGMTLQFRLKANPSKREHGTGKTRAITHRTEQVAWLERQASQHGFKLLDVDVIPVPNIYGRKAKTPASIKIVGVLYQGALQVSNPELFTQALRCGIGRGRSYGCGLLSIARLN
jgi:CRISPR system Cascade subunit CasE